MKNYLWIIVATFATLLFSCDDAEEATPELKIEISTTELSRDLAKGEVAATIVANAEIESIVFIEKPISSNGYFSLDGADLILELPLYLVTEDDITVSVNMMFTNGQFRVVDFTFLLTGESGVRLFPGVTKVTLPVGSEERYYAYYVPQDCPSDAPVWFIFHGSIKSDVEKTADEILNGCVSMLDSKGLKEVAEKEKVIIVQPHGLGFGPVKGTYSYGWMDKEADLAFWDEMLKYFQNIINADPKTFYASGKSSGGGMCYDLSCNRADDLAAITPICMNYGLRKKVIAGTIDDFMPENPTNLRVYLGTDDGIIRYSDEEFYVLDNMSVYAEYGYDCTKEPIISSGRIETIGNYEGFDLEITTYSSPLNKNFEIYGMVGIGHEWRTNLTPHIYEFLSQYTND